MARINQCKADAKINKDTILQMMSLSGGGRWIRTTEGIASRFTVGNKPSIHASSRFSDNIF